MRYILTLLFCASAFGADIGELRSCDSGLVGRWLVPGSVNSSSAFDLSNANSALANSNATPAAFVSNRQCVMLNGVNQQFASAVAKVPATADFTIVLWLSYNSTAAASWASQWASGDARRTLFHVNSSFANKVSIFYPVTGDSFVSDLLKGKSTWNQVGYIRSSGRLSPVLNGRVGASSAFTNSILQIGFRIGSATAAEFLNGSLSDARIYNRALSGEEVAALYKEQLR